MVNLTLSAPLGVLLPGGDPSRPTRRPVQVDAATWAELADQLRDRFPVLAQRVLNGGCDVNPSFVVVLNDMVTRRPGATLELRPGDEVYLLAAVAGG